MRKLAAALAFAIIYICGVLLSWNIPGIANNLTPIFAIAWLFVSAKIVSWLAVKAGWEKRNNEQ